MKYASDLKVALITGSGRGIGSAIATALAKEGVIVGINYLENDDAAKHTLELVRNEGGNGMLLKADVRDPNQVSKMVDALVNNFGQLDVLINNSHSPFEIKKIENLEWGLIDDQFHGTVRSSFLCTQKAIPFLKEAEAPVILNILTITNYERDIGFSHRNMAKAALAEFTRSLAVELGSFGIRANGLIVGWTETDQCDQIPEEYLDEKRKDIPLKRFASPEEIATFAAFLVSSKASYLSGTSIPIAGGLSPQFQDLYR